MIELRITAACDLDANALEREARAYFTFACYSSAASSVGSVADVFFPARDPAGNVRMGKAGKFFFYDSTTAFPSRAAGTG